MEFILRSTRISIEVSTHTFQGQFQHTYFKYSFNKRISSTVSTQTRQVHFQHAHFRCNFNTRIVSAVSKRTFQVQFQLTHFKYSFNSHISSTVSTRSHTHFQPVTPQHKQIYKNISKNKYIIANPATPACIFPRNKTKTNITSVFNTTITPSNLTLNHFLLAS